MITTTFIVALLWSAQIEPKTAEKDIGAVHGTVTDLAGTAIEDVSVLITGEDGKPLDEKKFRTLTAANGSYRIEGLTLGDRKVRFSLSGHSPNPKHEPCTVANGDNQVDTTLRNDAVTYVDETYDRIAKFWTERARSEGAGAYSLLWGPLTTEDKYWLSRHLSGSAAVNVIPQIEDYSKLDMETLMGTRTAVQICLDPRTAHPFMPGALTELDESVIFDVVVEAYREREPGTTPTPDTTKLWETINRTWGDAFVSKLQAELQKNQPDTIRFPDVRKRDGSPNRRDGGPR